MRICILGPMEVWEDGTELRVGGGRQQALLLLLTLHANEVVSTDRLIDALWPGTPPATAGKVVQTWISQLRKVLPEGALVTQRSGYVLRVAESDQGEFERLVRDAQARDPAEAATILRTALRL